MISPATGTTLQRTYLYVAPEEKSEVEALGARWDRNTKCWYIDADAATERFSRWLPGAGHDDDDYDDDDQFTILSDRAFVAAARTSCQHCHALIEVICIHCESGTVNGNELNRFTVSNIWAMDDALSRQLEPWPTFRLVDDGGDSYFANHCSSCGAPQDDMLLHSEPDQPFFSIPPAAPAPIDLITLTGTIQLSGDEHFEVD